MLIACESGSAKRLRCGYHGRRFGLDGALEAAPGFEGAENFPRPSDDLPQVQMGTWGPMHFVSLTDTTSMADWLKPLSPWLDFLDVDALIPDPGATQRYNVSANWKLYLDNYLEGFHIPTVHKSLAAALEVAAYRSECLVGGSLQIGMASPGGPTLPLGSHHPLAGQEVAALYFHLFPNTLINVYPWGVSINHVNPTGLDHTEVIFERYVGNPELLEQGAGSGLHRVELEDEAVVEATQKGVRSRLYSRGRYAPKHEAAVHHFHLWWANQI
jgi:choline monooxygenase